MMQLQDILFSQGFGTRRVCCGLVQQGLVQLGEQRQVCDDPTEVLDEQGLVFWVQGERWEYHAQAYLLLHKPAGTECSQKPSTYPSIYTLLPGPLRPRGGGAAAVGRRQVHSPSDFTAAPCAQGVRGATEASGHPGSGGALAGGCGAG